MYLIGYKCFTKILAPLCKLGNSKTSHISATFQNSKYVMIFKTYVLTYDASAYILGTNLCILSLWFFEFEKQSAPIMLCVLPKWKFFETRTNVILFPGDQDQKHL